MLKAKRTEREILDAFKKIDEALHFSGLMCKVAPLIAEWVNNGYDPNQVFKLGDNFKDIDKRTIHLPKEINILTCYVAFGGRELETVIKSLDPNRKFSDSATPLIFVCKLSGFYYDGPIIDQIKSCLKLGIDKNAIDDTGKTALDYLLTTASCKSRLKLEQKKPELKEVLEGFLTAEEIMTGKKADPIDLKERIEQLEQELAQVKAENLQLKQENAQLRQERSGPASTRLSEIEISKKELGARRS